MQVQLLPVLHHLTVLSSLADHAVKYQNTTLNIIEATRIVLESGNHIQNICKAGRRISKELGIKFDKLKLKDQLSLSTMAMNLQAFKEQQKSNNQKHADASLVYSSQIKDHGNTRAFKLAMPDTRQALISIQKNTFSQNYASEHHSLVILCEAVEMALIAAKGGVNFNYSVLASVGSDWLTYSNVEYLMGMGMGFLRERSGIHHEVTDLKASFHESYKSQLKIVTLYAKVYPNANGNSRIYNLIITCLNALKTDFLDISPQQYITATSFATAVLCDPDNEAQLLITAVESYTTYQPQSFLHYNKQKSFIYNSILELKIGIIEHLNKLPCTEDEKEVLLDLTLNNLFNTALAANLGTGSEQADFITRYFYSTETPQYNLNRMDNSGLKHTRICYAI